MSMHWKRRRNISRKEYDGCFQKHEVQAGAGQAENKSKLEKAYEQAAKIREFEISLYWKRATYFWAFIVSIYTAFFSVQKEFHYNEDNVFIHGTIPLLVLSALGFFFCLAWLCSSYASKHWQENWENHIDLLEDYVTGPLYKIYSAGRSFSVSKINIAAGWVVCICSAGLLVFEIVAFCEKLNGLSRLCFFVVIFGLVVGEVMAFCVWAKGNNKDSDEIEFDRKVYESEK